VNEETAATLEGYARAAEFIEQERMERLRNMSAEESRLIFDQLMADWSGPTEGDELGRLQEWRLETTVMVRQVFIKLAQSKGLV
jgi:hypothetical protein